MEWLYDLLLNDDTWFAVAVGLTGLLLFADGIAIGFIIGKNFPDALDDKNEEKRDDAISNGPTTTSIDNL